MPWQWPRGDPKMLAGFVNKQAGLYLPPLPFSTEDLGTRGTSIRITAFGGLPKRFIRCSRTRTSIMGRQSTCLGRKRPRSFASPQEVLTYKAAPAST